jgi:hypothetical protein
VDHCTQLAVLLATAFASSVLLGALAFLPASPPADAGRARHKHRPRHTAAQRLRRALHGAAEDLALVICGRTIPDDSSKASRFSWAPPILQTDAGH